MLKKTDKKYLYIFLALMFITAFPARAGEVPKNHLIISFGVSTLSMKPAIDSSINNFQLPYPGFYAKFSGENYYNATSFVHVDLNLSFIKGIMDYGTAKISRLNFNYGFGKCYERVKISVSPGLCYALAGYVNDANNKSVAESRFAPSLGLQTDLILIKSPNRYLGIFVEGSVMFAKPSRWVQQLAVGISWKPSFRKEEKEVMPQ